MTSSESAKRTYIHLIAYSLPATAFWVFADVVLMPRIELIWQKAGESAAKASWVIDLSRAFVDGLYFVLAGIVVILVLLENTWPPWQSLRRPVIRILAWLFTFCVMAIVTWTAVTACLVVPMALP